MEMVETANYVRYVDMIRAIAPIQSEVQGGAMLVSTAAKAIARAAQKKTNISRTPENGQK
jgi:hypothetical protein